MSVETANEPVAAVRVPGIQTVDFALPADYRCEICRAQAWVEVEVTATGSGLFFCAHHYHEHETALVLQASRVVDHRPALYKLEHVRIR